MIRKEIGGYFGLDELKADHYYKDLISLNSGRNALFYLIRSKNIQKLYLPEFLCESVKEMCVRNNVFIEFYSINEFFQPIFDKKLLPNEYMYIVNYYGQLSDEKILQLKNKYNQIIIDNAHSFFQRPCKNVETIYICRKFFGVADGAYLSTDIQLSEELEYDISFHRMYHILGRYEEEASKYYNSYKMVEQSLEKEKLKYMSKLTHTILGSIDYKLTYEKRTNNFLYLKNELDSYNQLDLITPVGPFAYPLFVENGEEIRKRLIEEKIYVPILWPRVLDDFPEDNLAYQFALNILPLPCDQRYDVKDMDRIVSSVKKYILG
jgi:hypothetical protein